MCLQGSSLTTIFQNNDTGIPLPASKWGLKWRKRERGKITEGADKKGNTQGKCGNP